MSVYLSADCHVFQVVVLSIIGGEEGCLVDVEDCADANLLLKDWAATLSFGSGKFDFH